MSQKGFAAIIIFIGIVISILLAVGGFNVGRLTNLKLAPKQVVTTSTTPTPLANNEKQHYLALSQAAEYIVYGRVTAELAETTRNIYPEPNNPLLVIPISRHHFSVDVIRYELAQGADDSQAFLPNRIILSEGDTTHSARFEIGELFFAFVRKDLNEDTYHVVGLTAGSLEGKFSVVNRDNQPQVVIGDNLSVEQLFDIAARYPQ